MTRCDVTLCSCSARALSLAAYLPWRDANERRNLAREQVCVCVQRLDVTIAA
jgi:hypothetical protein